MSGGLGAGDSAEGYFVAEGAELADELADLAVVVALAFIVVGAEVLVAGRSIFTPVRRRRSGVRG